MKNIILTFLTVCTLASCKKTETANSEDSSSSSINADSSSVANNSQFDSISKPFNLNKDSAVAIKKDTAIVKIQKLNDEKKLLTEKVAKEMDSATRSTIVSEIKITQKKIDSVRTALVSNTKKRKISPKVIRETKVIYREIPKREAIVSAPKITKTGSLEIQVDNMEIAKYSTKEQISKYDGKVKSEQISSDDMQQISYLKILVPFDKSDYLINDLENNVGKIVSRDIQITGEQYAKNSVCTLDISLVKDFEKGAVVSTPKSFGGRSLGAVGSGWNVIEEIFLFILPFWPMFLIGGGLYYFLKRKKSEEAK